MKQKMLAASLLLLCSHHAYSDSFTNLLKESLKQALKEGQTTEQQPQTSSIALPSSSSEAYTPSPPTASVAQPALSADDQVLMIQGMWRDPKTNLVWQRCALGQSWSGAQCSGEPTNYLWMDAVMLVKGLNLAGKNDWRIPTQAELLTVFRCNEYDPQKTKPDDNGCANRFNSEDESSGTSDPKFDETIFPINPASDSYGHTPKKFGYWTATVVGDPEALIRAHAVSESPYITNEDLARAVAFTNNARIEKALRAPIENGYAGYFGYNVLLVRGGNPDGFKKAVNIAQTQLDAMPLEKQTREALAEKRRIEEAARSAEKAKQYQMAQERAAQAEKAYQLKTVEFRKRVKAGDRTVDGLVIAAKGDLVKVQRYGKQCVLYTTTLNPYSHQPDCLRYSHVVLGEEWQRRSDILPLK